MARKLSRYDPKYDWVKVRSNRKHSLGRRKWNDFTNMLIGEDEEVILPRGSSDEDENLNGMKFYFKNGFYEVVDSEPFSHRNKVESEETDNDEEAEDAPESDDEDDSFECGECGKEFDTERGVKQHKSMTHEKEDDKNEEKGE